MACKPITCRLLHGSWITVSVALHWVIHSSDSSHNAQKMVQNSRIIIITVLSQRYLQIIPALRISVDQFTKLC